MLGRGLESLIPKKNKDSGKQFQKTSGSSSPVTEEHLNSHSRGNQSLPADQPRESSLPRRQVGETFPSAVPRGPDRPRKESIFHIEVEKTKPNPYQPRRNFKEEDLAELANSIREFGIIQPLVVTKIEKETPTGTEVTYQLVAGERRLMAAKLIGLRSVPAIVRHFDAHRTKLEVALVENVQRSSLSPIEAARAYARLQDEFSLTQREIAAKIGKSRETVANAVRLLNLPTDIQEALSEGRINESQARVLLASSSPVGQKELFEKFLEGKTAAGVKKTPAPVDPEAKYWERRLEEKLGHSVEIRRKKGKGKMTVRFHSDAEWQSILDKIMGPDAD